MKFCLYRTITRPLLKLLKNPNKIQKVEGLTIIHVQTGSGYCKYFGLYGVFPKKSILKI